MYDLIIIGGGPAGCAAAVYAGRKKLKTLLITESFGGQSLVSGSIENWIGTKSLSGYELAQNLEAHVREQEDVEIKMPERAQELKEIEGGFEVTSDLKNTYQAKALLIVSGGRRKRLNVPGEDKFEGKGVVYCSTCDAPLFRNKTVAVIGSGNSALEGVEDLLSYASKIYLLIRGDGVKGDPLTFEKIKNSDKVEIILNAESKEVTGATIVEGLKYIDRTSQEEKTLSLQGVFVEIGSIPNSDFAKGFVDMNERDQIIMNHRSGETSRKGVFTAGAVSDQLYDQNNISVGDAIKATLSAYQYLQKMKK